MSRVVHFDLLSGASGDMLLASLLDFGVPVSFLESEFAKLKIPGLTVGSSRVKRNGISCRRLNLRWKPAEAYRHLPEISGIIRRAKYSRPVEARCLDVLERLAAAEAAVHGIPKSRVHFHEIGAVDTIVDIVGFVIALDYLSVNEVTFGSLTDGHGTISTAHGVLPVPVPATLRLARGLHMTRLDILGELLTPTGCALLTTLGTQSLVPPSGVVERIGQGCGTREFGTHPNFLRAMIIETAGDGADAYGDDMVNVLESDIDHISGEVMGDAAGVLMENGALDVSWMPLFMKKGRPGYRLTVIAPVAATARLAELTISHTRTLGVRIALVRRVVAKRKMRSGALSGQPIAEKVCSYKGRQFVKAEYEDLARIARKEGRPLLEIIDRYNACRR